MILVNLFPFAVTRPHQWGFCTPRCIATSRIPGSNHNKQESSSKAMTVCYQQRCCVAEQAAGLKRRPLWDWSREPRPWQCWSPSAGCSHPGPTPSTGCRCPAWTPWGGGTQRGLFLESVRRSGPYCQCWWRIRWSSGLESAAREKGRWIWSGLIESS